MKKFVAPVFICICILALLMAGAASDRRAVSIPPLGPSSGAVAPVPDFGSVPLYFIPNRGQAGTPAAYYARASRYTLWLTKTGLVFDSSRPLGKPGSDARADGGSGRASRTTWDRDVSELIFPGANQRPLIEAIDVSEHHVNLFLGSDPSGWRTGLATSRAVLYKDLFKNTDLKVYGVEKEIEYDWIVKPGGEVADIRFEYRGVLGTSLEPDGSLRVRTRFGDLIHRKPEAYQTIAGRRQDVDVRFGSLGDNRYQFIAGDYDPSQALVIDPVVLVSSTYLGGAKRDVGHGLALDGAGNIYITGDTQSSNFPTKNALDPTLSGSGRDMIIAKMSASGKSLVYSTYLGGSDWDSGDSIVVDATGAAYIAGWTMSSNFPVQKAFDPTFNGNYDGVFLKLNPAGDALVFSSYLGAKNTKSSDSCNTILLDGQGNIYLTGTTDGPDFPVKAGYDMTWNGKTDTFIAKFAASGRSLIYSTYLGGAADDYVAGMAVDSQGAVAVPGWTASPNFPKKYSYQKTIKGERDVFVTKLNPGGTTLAYSTVFGGSDSDRPSDVKLDGSGNAFIVGSTESKDFPVLKAFDPSWNGGDGDGFLTKIGPTGKEFVFSTYLGGNGEDEAESVALDGQGNICVLSTVASSNMPVKNAYDNNLSGDEDAHLAKFAPSGKSLVFATYFGGSKEDSGSQLALDGAGNIYVLGATNSLDLSIKNAFDKTFNGEWDIYVAKLSEGSAAAARGRSSH